MELDITEFYNNAEPTYYYDSVANSGLKNIGQITWERAKQETVYNFVTDGTREALQAYMTSLDDDWSGLSDDELNALTIQLIASEIKEKKGMTWDEYERAIKEGLISGLLFRTDYGRIYIDIDA